MAENEEKFDPKEWGLNPDEVESSEEGSSPEGGGTVEAAAKEEADERKDVSAVEDGGGPPKGNGSRDDNLGFILDISLDITVELGKTKMMIKDLLQLGQGSVVELSKQVGEPVDIYVNDKLIAKGEVVSVDDSYGVRLTDIVSPTERIKKLA